MAWQVAASDRFSVSIQEIRERWTMVDVIDAMLFLSLSDEITAAAHSVKS